MIDIAIYGAGGLGREIASLINIINERKGKIWNLIGFFDDGVVSGSEISHFGKILGGINEVNHWDKPLNLVFCFGNPNTLSSIKGKITNDKISYPNIIHPDFCIADKETFSIGEGNIIQWNCFVSTDVKIGDFNLLNGEVVMGHDVKIGNFNVFMPGSRISGEVTIGNQNLFGSDSFIKQQLKVGNKVVLSPHSVLLKKPKDENIYIGNPAKIFKF